MTYAAPQAPSIDSTTQRLQDVDFDMMGTASKVLAPALFLFTSATTTAVAAAATAAAAMAAAAAGSRMAPALSVLLIGCISTGPGPNAAGIVEHCGEITQDEVWTSEALHVITCEVDVYEATLFIEAGARVEVSADYALTISREGNAGGLVTMGTPEEPVVFTAHNGDIPGSWTGIAIYPDAADANLELFNTRIEWGGGYTGGYSGGLRIYDAEVYVEGLELTGSDSWGLLMTDDARLAEGSAGLVVTSNAKAAFGRRAESLGSLPADSLFLDNDDNSLESKGGTINEDTTLHAFDAPYVFDEQVDVGSSDGGATLTIEAGSTLRFVEDGGLSVGSDSNGTLIAQGTQEWPIVFMGDGGAGSWDGIKFGPSATDSVLDYVDVADGGYRANVEVWTDAEVLVDHAFIHNSATCGIALVSGGAPTLKEVEYQDNAEGDLCE